MLVQLGLGAMVVETDGTREAAGDTVGTVDC